MRRVDRRRARLHHATPAYQVKTADLFLGSLQDLLKVEDCEHIFKQAKLGFIIGRGIGSHRRRRIDLDEPRLQIRVQQDIKAVQFEAMLIIHDCLGDGLQTLDDELVDLLIRVVHSFVAELAHEVQFHAAQVPFTSELIVVVV